MDDSIASARVAFRAVVRAEPEHRVPLDFQFAQPVSQPADLFIQQLTQIMLREMPHTSSMAPNAKCAPSRASILARRNSWQLEEAANHWCFFPAKFKVYTDALAEHGYQVGMTGKGWAPGIAKDAEGKTRHLAGTPFQKRTTRRPTSGISNRDCAANFQDFLDSIDRSQPWCFWYGGHEPHRRYEYGSGIAKGGHAARFRDEDLGDEWVKQSVKWIEQNRDGPFFLFFASHDVHVPRMPHERFQGKTPLGFRGDAIVELDWCVGQLLECLDRLKMAEDTLVVFCSDNGPVLDDGYKDRAIEKVDDHKPAGPFSGGKYSILEGGTRTPFITRWPGRIKPGVSDQVVCTIDLAADPKYAAERARLEELLAQARKHIGDPVDFDSSSPAPTRPAKSGRKSAQKRP